MAGPRKSRIRLWIRLIYLAVVIIAAVALWFLVPDDVKKAIYETYINPR
jgi:hypothetical protein